MKTKIAKIKMARNANKRNQHELSYILSQLNNFSNYLSQGYSDYTWTSIAKILHNLNDYLFQGEREILASIWRNAYINPNDKKYITEIEFLKQKIVSVS